MHCSTQLPAFSCAAGEKKIWKKRTEVKDFARMTEKEKEQPTKLASPQEDEEQERRRRKVQQATTTFSRVVEHLDEERRTLRRLNRSRRAVEAPKVEDQVKRVKEILALCDTRFAVPGAAGSSTPQYAKVLADYQTLRAQTVDEIRTAESAERRTSSVPPPSKRPKSKQPRAARTQPAADSDLNSDASSEQEMLLSDADATYKENRRKEMQKILDELNEVKEAQETISSYVVAQQEGITAAEANAAEASQRTTEGRKQLVSASKMKLGLLWTTGALIGGVIGGPVGMIAGAKTAAVIAGCVLAGGVTGGLVSKNIGKVVHAANTTSVDEANPPPAGNQIVQPKGSS